MRNFDGKKVRLHLGKLRVQFRDGIIHIGRGSVGVFFSARSISILLFSDLLVGSMTAGFSRLAVLDATEKLFICSCTHMRLHSVRVASP